MSFEGLDALAGFEEPDFDGSVVRSGDYVFTGKSDATDNSFMSYKFLYLCSGCGTENFNGKIFLGISNMLSSRVKMS